ncbi:MAG: endonuclease domain-containing protein [Candidatus Marinimicrobia bacterium]|nr:endonuclease domain-containing protein [Candidatus Neomarinimicrobiota bacterium]
MPRGEFHTHHRIKSVRGIARELRKAPTLSEDLLWQALRNRQLQGLKFLRQHPVGPSIVDFYCHEKRLAVEIDGPIHNQRDVAERDQARQELVEAYGIRFFRCTSAEVERSLEEVLKRILEAADE